MNLVYVGTSVTSPAPKFLIGGTDNQHLHHNSTLALDADTGEIVWISQRRPFRRENTNEYGAVLV